MLYAYANWGRWVCDCPKCNSAELVKEFGRPPRIQSFRCTECGFAETLALPDDPDAIEAVLVKRPKRDNRNWRPGETLADLILENVVHGVEDI